MNRLALVSLLVVAVLGTTGLASGESASDEIDGWNGQQRPLSVQDDTWRHTRLGWERSEEWRPPIAEQPWLDLRPLHPALLGALLGLVAVGALLVDEESRRE